LRSVGFKQTFIGVLIKPSKGVDLIVPDIRHGSIDQACGDMALGLLYARAVIRTAPTGGGGT